MPRGKPASTNQKHYPALGSDTSSVRNLCPHFSDIISQGNHRCLREMSLFSQASMILAISSQSCSAHVEERDQELWGTLEQDGL